MKRKRNIFVASLLCCLTLLIPTAAVAETDFAQIDTQVSRSIQPRLTYIEAAETGLDIKNGVATVDCWVKGDILSATKAKVIAELQLKSGNSWIAYGTWTSTQNDYEAYVYKTKAVTEGHTYRVKATYTVWEGTASEEIIVFGDEVTA